MISSWERLVNYTRVRKCLGVAPALLVLDIIGRFLPRCNTSSAEATPRNVSAIDISNIYWVITSFSIWSKCHTQNNYLASVLHHTQTLQPYQNKLMSDVTNVPKNKYLKCPSYLQVTGNEENCFIVQIIRIHESGT